MSDEGTGKDGLQRSDQDRRAENRRKINKGPSENERRGKDGEGRGFWVGRRQTAEWRRDS